MGVEFAFKMINYQGKNYHLQLWDTTGEQFFQNILSAYIKNTNCTLIIFDVTSKDSLEEIKVWENLSY